MRRHSAEIRVPHGSDALRDVLATKLTERWPHCDFTFVESHNVDHAMLARVSPECADFLDIAAAIAHFEQEFTTTGGGAA